MTVSFPITAAAYGAEPFPPPLTAQDIARMEREDAGEDQVGPVPFPHPPTLADIVRMEPHLSPLSMRRRASDCGHDDPARGPFGCGLTYHGAFDEVIEESSPLVFTRYEDLEHYEAPAPKAEEIDPKQEQRAVLSAIAEWISDYMYEMACSGRIPNPFQMPMAALPFSRSLNVQRITNILLSTLMPTSVSFLALVYVNRLVDKLSRRLARGQQEGGVKAFMTAITSGGPVTVDVFITRLFMVGLMLADKWLDDHSFAVRTWRDVSYVPARILHTMEMAALQIFDYHLMIPQAKWVDYLERLRTANGNMLAAQLGSSALPPAAIVHIVLHDLIDASRAARAEAEPQFLEHSRASIPPPPPLPKLAPLQDTWSEIRFAKRASVERPRLLSPPRSASSASKRKLPPPAEWSPEADPIISKARRTGNGAVGAERNVSRREPIWASVSGVAEKLFSSGGGHGRAASLATRGTYGDVTGLLERPSSLVGPLRVRNA